MLAQAVGRATHVRHAKAFRAWCHGLRVIQRAKQDSLRAALANAEQKLQRARVESTNHEVRVTDDGMQALLQAKLADKTTSVMHQHHLELANQIREQVQARTEVEGSRAELEAAVRARNLKAEEAWENAGRVRSELEQKRASVNDRLREQRLEQALGGETAAQEHAKLQRHLQERDEQLSDRQQSTTEARLRMSQRMEELEEQLEREMSQRQVVQLGYHEMEFQLTEKEKELTGARAAVEKARQEVDISREELKSDLQNEHVEESVLREDAERRLNATLHQNSLSQQQLNELRALAEETTSELHATVAELKLTMHNQLVQENSKGKAADLRYASLQSQLRAVEDELAATRASLQHAEQELPLQKRAYIEKLQNDDVLTAAAQKKYEDLCVLYERMQRQLHAAKKSADSDRKRSLTQVAQLTSRLKIDQADTNLRGKAFRTHPYFLRRLRCFEHGACW
jgi:hypothetical protein